MGYICGIDEVGRGPIAGPVTAAAVILNEDFPVDQLRDSKRLSSKRRAVLEPMIKEEAIAWGIGWVSPKMIDKINILQASLLAMRRAYEQMCTTFSIEQIQLVLIDGNTFPPIDNDMFAIIKGDGAVPEVMAASIIAKEARDRWMRKIAIQYPLWEFARHKGYPTRLHKELCVIHGLSPIHRKSFRIFS